MISLAICLYIFLWTDKVGGHFLCCPFRLKSQSDWSPLPPPIDALAVKNFPILYFGKEICYHSNGNKLHKVQESAASVVGDKHQASKGWMWNTSFIIYNVSDGLNLLIISTQGCKLVEHGSGSARCRAYIFPVIINFPIYVSAHAR